MAETHPQGAASPRSHGTRRIRVPAPPAGTVETGEFSYPVATPRGEDSQEQANVEVSRPGPIGDGYIRGIRRESLAYQSAKRALDLAVSAVTLTLAAPAMAAIAIAIKLESPGPVFFRHERLEKGGNVFRCLKFRSMRLGAHEDLQMNPVLRRLYEQHDYKIPLELDGRVTRVGRFLRRSSLDELPQLINVLRGEMSLVGPRPIVPEELHWYGRSAERFLSVKPGITGAWQIQGRSRIGYPDRTLVELEGIEARSFWTDLKILLKSLPAVITARGSL